MRQRTMQQRWAHIGAAAMRTAAEWHADAVAGRRIGRMHKRNSYVTDSIDNTDNTYSTVNLGTRSIEHQSLTRAALGSRQVGSGLGAP